MKNTDKQQGALWPTAEQVEEAHEELKKRILDEELQSARREAVKGLAMHLKLDRKNFLRLWIRPLMEAGATLDVALASIARSCFQPN